MYAIDRDRALDREKLLCYDFYAKETLIFIGLESFFHEVNKQHQVKSFDNIHL